MAVISPALVLAMIVMFLLTRVHVVRFTFEHLFFFGLRYCIEPSRTQIAALISSDTSSSSAAYTTPNRGKKPQSGGKKSGKDSAKPGQRLASMTLPIIRGTVTPEFFATEEEIPFLQEFDHLLSVTTGYVVGLILEEALTCYFPQMFVESHIWWLSGFATFMAIFESCKLASKRIGKNVPYVTTAVGSLFSLALIAAGELGNFVRFGTAFQALQDAAAKLMVTRLQVQELAAAQAANTLSFVLRILSALVAGMIFASAVYPGIRIANIDYAMFRSFRLSDADRKADPFALPKPKPFSMALISLDYILSCVVMVLWSLSSRTEVEKGNSLRLYGGSRVGITIGVVIVRFLCARIRLQRYLDSAVEHYRDFWRYRPALGVVPAGEQLKYNVVNTSYNLTMIGMTSILSPVLILALALTAKRSGGISFGLCRSAAVAPSSGQIFVREVIGFLSWVSVSSYIACAAFAFVYQIVADLLDPANNPKYQKVPPPVKSSERRRQRRVLDSIAGKTTSA